VVVWGLNNIPPLAAGYPPYEEKRWALLPTVAKPPWCAKGGDTPLPVGNGVRSRKNRKLPVCDFFCYQAAYYARPEPINLQDKRTMPHS